MDRAQQEECSGGQQAHGVSGLRHGLERVAGLQGGRALRQTASEVAGLAVRARASQAGKHRQAAGATSTSRPLTCTPATAASHLQKHGIVCRHGL